MKKFKLMLSLFMFLLVVGFVDVKALDVTENLTLEADLTEVVTVSGKNVTIDLNGHSIRVAANGALRVLDGADVTVTGEGTIESTNNNGVVVSNGSKLTLQSGDIKSVEFGVLVTKDSTFTMNGGKITTSDNCGIGGNGSNTDQYKNYTINFNGGTIDANIESAGYVSCGIYHPNKGTVNVTGGTINSSNGAGIVQRAGTLNVTGGTINAVGTSTGKVGDSRVVVSASAIVVDKEAAYPEVGTLVTKVSNNAKLNGATSSIETIGENVVVELTGGIYNEEPEAAQVPEGYSVYKILEGENADKFVVVDPDELVNEVANGIVDKADLPAADVALIEDAVGSQYKLASFYIVDLITLTKDGDIVGFVSEPDEAVTVQLGLPLDLPKVASGYVRKYYVIRVHDGKVTIIKDVTDNGDDTVSFKSDEFSSYAIAYEDTKQETATATGTEDKKTDVATTTNPKTSDNILISVSLLMVSAFVAFEGLKYYNKKNN